MEEDPTNKSYQIATIVLFLSTLAPFWISYSALLKIAYMKDRYHPDKVKKKTCFRKFLMMIFLTFLGTILLILSKIVLALGEFVAILPFFICK